MFPGQSTTKKPISEENSIPASSQEPTADAPIPPIDSEPTEAPSEAPEAPREGFSDESNNITLPNSTPTEVVNEPKSEEKSAQNELNTKPVSEPVQAIEPSTAQMAGNEPLTEPEQVETPESKPSETKPETSRPTEATPPLPVKTFRNTTKENLAKAQLTIQNKKRRKLDLIITLFAKRKNITNDEVEKFLHVSDATATRYLLILEKEGKIKQNGKTGHMVSYSKI